MTRAILLALLVASVLTAGAQAATPTKPAAPRGTASQKQPPSSAPRAGNRTLEDIHIEGEIPVPQVLFITARDQRRFMEFQHGRYLRTSRQLGAATPLPSRVVLNRVTPTPAKETSR